jgi:hypothetical protein
MGQRLVQFATARIDGECGLERGFVIGQTVIDPMRSGAQRVGLERVGVDLQDFIELFGCVGVAFGFQVHARLDELGFVKIRIDGERLG